MYVTRALSSYRRNPIELSAAAAGGPHSGLMVMRGEEADEEEGRGCLSSGCGYAQGLFPKITRPQNAVLHNTYSDSGDDCLFIPLLDQPLSSNRYHVIHANGIHKGLASRCSTEEGMNTNSMKSAVIVMLASMPSPLFLIVFLQVSSGSNFILFVKTSEVYHLDDAQGLDHSLRMSLPELDFTRIIIGKWYTPFVFVKGEGPVKVQMEKYLFYTITLEKRWQKIHSCENHGSKGNAIAVNISVQREVNFLFGTEAEKDSGMDNDGLIWFRVYDHRREVNKVGLSLAFVERMRWLEQSARWVDGVERFERVETASGVGWRRFCCYVLVESFVLRRMDGTLVLNCDFRHTNEIQTKWQ
ncbi:Protein of unknown function DUF1262 - like 3 [Theobroma cacao]|nr:Protein of unknown function DUF1262 - like 3 [Theobroma cacao]